MNSDPIKLLSQFSTETVARSLDILELAGCDEKICQAVRKGIYALRDTFVLKIKDGGVDYDSQRKR